MDAWLDGRHLIFAIPLALGLLLVVGAAFGLVDDGSDASTLDGDTSLGLGRFPLGLTLVAWLLGFGGGFVALLLFDRAGVSEGLGTWLAVLVGLVSGGLLSRGLRLLLTRSLKLFASSVASRSTLVGSAGRVVVLVSERGGAVQVHDSRGDLHQVSCVCDGGEAPLQPGTAVLLIEYDENRGGFVVTRAPI